MNKFPFIIFVFIFLISISGCNRILEPVIFGNEDINIMGINEQEEFAINIKPLTFENALDANKSQYVRKVMVSGSGLRSKVVNESEFLISNFPEALTDKIYRLGVGDGVSFVLVNKFLENTVQWPPKSKPKDYILGVGDKLSFIQLTENEQAGVNFNEGGDISFEDGETNLLKSQGIIGSNGNILLLGIGNILAANRSLVSLRNEVSNILIRSGLAPNFQLDIIEFNSKKAYYVHSKGGNVLPIDNIPFELKDVAMIKGTSSSSKNLSLITLMRGKKSYRFTAKQLFDDKAQKIFIQDKDQILIESFNDERITIDTHVGLDGNIILPVVGTLQVYNRPLASINEEIKQILYNQGLISNFQLELTKFESKKAYLISKAYGSVIVPLTNSRNTLKEIILKNFTKTKNDNLDIITLQRNNNEYRLPLDVIYDNKTPTIFIQDGDQIKIESLTYKQGEVYALSGSGNASIIPINASNRETLANILFVSDGALSNRSAKRSEIYLLRGQKPVTAYHLDAQNVSRILVAAKTELRPNDIIYVADRQIISFSRLLFEISPLRGLINDIAEGNIQ